MSLLHSIFLALLLTAWMRTAWRVATGFRLSPRITKRAPLLCFSPHASPATSPPAEPPPLHCPWRRLLRCFGCSLFVWTAGFFARMREFQTPSQALHSPRTLAVRKTFQEAPTAFEALSETKCCCTSYQLCWAQYAYRCYSYQPLAGQREIRNTNHPVSSARRHFLSLSSWIPDVFVPSPSHHLQRRPTRHHPTALWYFPYT